MRVLVEAGDFRAKAIAGTRTILIALDCKPARRNKLLGFGFFREVVGQAGGGKWLRSQKVFKSIVPNPKEARDPNDPTQPLRISTEEHPIQSFLWGDYTAEPNTRYKFRVVPMYGQPGALQPAPALEFEVTTEKEFDGKHGVWFNRGAIASQAYAREFSNEPPQNPNDPNDPRVRWLSRGLLEACIAFIDGIPAGDALRVAAYEFTYPPVLDALKRAQGRGVDVKIIHDDTRKADGSAGPNEQALTAAGFKKTHQGQKILFPRAEPEIPHNKFIVHLVGGTVATAVWTGSTNFTPSGFLGQTNVGHLIMDGPTADEYMAYWNILRPDPILDDARADVMNLTPYPPTLVPERSITRVFSPRPKSDLLKWYAQRIEDALGCVMFTAAFGVAKQLVPALTTESDHLRFILMEKPPTDALAQEFKKDRDLVFSYGAVLGEMYVFKNGEPVARRGIKDFGLERWFLKEEHYRKANEGFVFFIHTKFLLVDPLSNDPLVCSGSANFSSNSLLRNDENMLLIRGDTRVADIYLTEFDRIFRHFYFRDIANQIEANGEDAEGAFLDETSKWTDSYFKPGAYKSVRRQMFFADPAVNWVAQAKKRVGP
jgi:phosphatidylserine/phosphatidylglycerophosphate/cardiolipin synthase-like enzyme